MPRKDEAASHDSQDTNVVNQEANQEACKAPTASVKRYDFHVNGIDQ